MSENAEVCRVKGKGLIYTCKDCGEEYGNADDAIECCQVIGE